jgi:hypothetical protein
LSQQELPSTGCAQHAPLFSSFVTLGVQHTRASLLGAQHDEATTSFFLDTNLIR